MEDPIPLNPLPGTGPIGAKEALDTIVTNYGICETNAGNQKALQEWVRDEKAIK
jgi:hypothetical protein